MRPTKSRTDSIVRRTGRILGGLLLATASLLPATDEPLTLPMSVTEAPGAEADLTMEDGNVLLSLEQVITLALERNLALVVQRYRHDYVRLALREAIGIYDLNLQLVVDTSTSARAPTSTLEAAAVVDVTTDQASLSASQLTPLGGTLRAVFNNAQTESSNVFDQPSPRYSTDFSVEYTQPLLRNLGRLATERNVVVARVNRAISREDFQAQVEAIIQSVATAYWALVEYREQLAVAEESLHLAEELHEMNRIQVEVGTLAPLEMVQSEAGVAARQEDIIRLGALVEDSADNLRRLMNLAHGELWDHPIVPLTEPETPFITVDLEQAVTSALENRVDLRRLRLDQKVRQIDAKIARNRKRPRLDAYAGWGVSGTAGLIKEVDRQTGEFVLDPVTGEPIVLVDTGYGDALEQLRNRDFEGWMVQLTFGYPLQNRTAKAASARADLYLEQSDQEVRDLEQQILTDVRRTARAVRTAAQRIDSAKVSSRLAQRNLEAERKRYENGLSTSFQVLEIQENLSQERSREVSAIVSYRRALVDYHLATGRLLEEAGVVLADGE